MQSEGLPKLLSEINEIINNKNDNLGKLKEDINKAGEKLEVTTPELESGLRDENALDEAMNEEENIER